MAEELKLRLRLRVRLRLRQRFSRKSFRCLFLFISSPSSWFSFSSSFLLLPFLFLSSTRVGNFFLLYSNILSPYCQRRTTYSLQRKLYKVYILYCIVYILYIVYCGYLHHKKTWTLSLSFLLYVVCSTFHLHSFHQQ